MRDSPAAVARHARNDVLWARTAQVAGRLNRAHAELVEIAVELVEDGHWGDGGFLSPQHYLVVRAGLSPAHAADVVRVATRRGELPDAAAALDAGELSLDQVAVVARSVPAAYQSSVTHLARHATVPQLRRAVSRHAFPAAEPSPAPNQGDEPAGEQGTMAEQRACARPELSMRYDADGRFQLRYSAPATVGALVEQAVKEAKDALFTGQVDGAAEGDGPSYADALEELATRSLATVTSTSRAAHYRVYLHLSTDGAWLNAGPAIPRRLLGRFLSDGVLQPVWETDAQPVSVGRAMRILPERTRRLLEDRDRGCRFPGCTTTRFVEIHHLHPWAEGGPTDTDNQVSLCPRHHDALDRGDYRLTGDPTRPDGLVAVNRYGLPVRPPTRAETAAPPGGDPPVPPDTYSPPTGERARWPDIELPADADLSPPRPSLSLVTGAPVDAWPVAPALEDP